MRKPLLLIIIGLLLLQVVDKTQALRPPANRPPTADQQDEQEEGGGGGGGGGDNSPSKTTPTTNILVETSSSYPPPTTTTPTTPTMNQILIKAAHKGLGGGIPGFVAGIVQVLSLMWLRTIVNYQSRYGTSFREALHTLYYKQGGLSRLYSGLGFALVQAPLSRFVSTASNDGCQVFLNGFPPTKNWGPGRTTIIASIVVGLWRIALMPVDTCKTVLQVDSMDGFKHLLRRVKAGQFGLLYQGSMALAGIGI